jgi:hypothetical protein
VKSLIIALAALSIGTTAHAAEWPYFITYSQKMEEPGNLEIANKTVTGRPQGDHRFFGSAVELEYGVKTWWTTEFYLDGQKTAGDAAFFTGYRWENRFRLLPREHWINPVLYVEYEHINGADKSLLEVVGHDGQEDLGGPNADGRAELKREIEAKLILGSHVKGWNISENFIAEKNLAHEPFEFGYALAASRPLAMEARAEECTFCLENLRAGVELYGGLGTHEQFGWRGTSQYIAPTIGFDIGHGASIKVSPGFGLTATSAPFLLRFGVSYEVAQFGRAAGRLFH